MHTSRMSSRLDSETARMLLEGYRTWFGPPPINWENRYIDGRVRFREAVALRIQIPPAVKAKTIGDAARLLCLSGHYDRARLLVPAELICAADVGAFCGCPSEVVAAMCRKSRRHMKNVRGYNTARRREAIEGMGRLLRKAEEGMGFVTADEIRKVLAPWL